MKDEQRFCPNCGSENVEPDFRRTNVLGEMIFNQNKWVCNECGYTGIMPQLSQEENCSEQQPEGLMRHSGEPEGDVEFEPENQETVDSEAGSAYFKYTIYIMIPLTLLFLIAVLLGF